MGWKWRAGDIFGPNFDEIPGAAATDAERRLSSDAQALTASYLAHSQSGVIVAELEYRYVYINQTASE